MSTFLDVDAETLRVLEFEQVLDWVAGYAASPGGKRAVAALRPSNDPALVALELQRLDEMLRVLESQGRVLPAGMPDAAPAGDLLALDGARIEPRALLDLARVVSYGADAAAMLRRVAAELYPRLREIAADLPDLSAQAAPVLRGTDPDGRILDAASPELSRLRARGTRAAERLRTALERRLRTPAAGGWARDDFVTERNGRFVIPVRTDAPHPPQGIVHGTSSSGATRFVEPLDAVEANNERVRLREAAGAEELRIVLEWAEAFRARRAELGTLLSGVARLDCLQARAAFGRDCGGVCPQVEARAPVSLRGVRHPLLARHLAEIGGRCVPLDLRLDPFDRTLVVSGPNTGGKTVALKTLGLAVLMAQSGLPVPGDEVLLPLYDQLRADIGDRQSIHADLSTFSAHVLALRRFLAEAQGASLFLLDEPGTGTEPAEGAALAVSVLQELAGDGRTIAATTHLGTVKAWAVSDPRVEIAATEFDEATLRPTYRLLVGVPGSSSGLDIAERIGLDRRVVGRARELLDDDGRLAELYLKQLRELVASREREIDALERQRAQIDERSKQERERAEHERVESRRRVERELGEALRDIDREARRELATLKQQSARSGAERKWSRARGRLERRGAGATERIAGGDDTKDAAEWRSAERVEPGARVKVRGFDGDAVVVDVSGDSVEVRLGAVRLRVRRDELGVPTVSGATGEQSGGRTSVVRTAERSSAVGPELRLLGMRVDEASAALERYLDGARLAGHVRVRVIHGHGSGVLRRVVRERLREHPLVARFRAGDEGEGGDGATVVELS